MRREIEEIPDAVAALLESDAGPVDEAAAAIRRARPAVISVAGRGTSDHAAVFAHYLLEVTAGVRVAMLAPAVTTIYGASLWRRGDVLVAISQSGQPSDVVTLSEAARRRGATTIAITNHADSALAGAADHVLLCRAGREEAVPATKTYALTLAVLARLTARLAPRAGLAGALERLPDALRDGMDRARAWLDRSERRNGSVVEEFAATNRALVASRGYNLATALEVALKLKEGAGLFAEGYATPDLLHGPIVLAGGRVPTLIIRPDGPMGRVIDDAIAALRRRGAHPYLVGGREVARRARSLSLPSPLPEGLTPLLFALPGQLLAEAVGRRRGLNPDYPIGLDKVTRTR
jgi:glutamine---fructose-6-phosphate transaminase (isomerizing)